MMYFIGRGRCSITCHYANQCRATGARRATLTPWERLHAAFMHWPGGRGKPALQFFGGDETKNWVGIIC
jgi:hypothetical protein